MLSSKVKTTGAVAQSELKNIIASFKELPSSIKLHILDPAEITGISGRVEFTEPVPVRSTVFIDPANRGLTLIVNSNKLFLKSVEFLDGGVVRTIAEFEVHPLTGPPSEFRAKYSTYVEGLSLLFHNEAYAAYKAGQVDVQSPELGDFLAFLDIAIQDIAQRPENRLYTAKDVFGQYHANTRIGEFLIFESGAWKAFEFVTDWRGDDVEFLGLALIDGHPYLTLYNVFLDRVDSVGIEAMKSANYRLKLSTLARLPVANTIKELYVSGKEVLNNYFELNKLVFLGVKASVT